MNPIPPMIDGRGVVLDPAAFNLFAMALMAGVLLFYILVLWAIRKAGRVREHVLCPLRRRMATVIFRVTPDGSRIDVVQCSLIRGETGIRCGKECLRSAMPATASSHA